MASRKIVGCGAGIGIAMLFLFGIAMVATLLMEFGVPEKLLVRIGGLLGMGGMAYGYHVSEKIGAGGAAKSGTAKGGASDTEGG